MIERVHRTDFGEKIRELRMHMTASEIALRVGLHHSQVSRIGSGQIRAVEYDIGVRILSELKFVKEMARRK